jgi:Tfp pilus assembly protein PilO
MFKNLKKNEKIMLLVLAFGLIAFAYYMLIISPYLTKRIDLSTQITELEGKVRPDTSLNSEIKNLDNEIKRIDRDINGFTEDKFLQIITHKDFVEFIGLNSKVYEVTVKEFKETENKDESEYKKKVYSLSVQGDYNNIVQFSNSLYLLRNHFYVKNMRLEKVDLIPMTATVKNGDDTKLETLTFDWFSKYNSKIDRIIPPDLLEGIIPENLTKYDSGYSEADKVYKKPEYNKEITELQFELHFIDYESK